MFNWAIRRPIAKSRVSSGSGGRNSETFVEEYWEEGVTEEYEKLKSNLDLNPGQVGILESEQDFILDYLFEISEGYTPDDFLSFLQTELEDDNRYEALSITWEEYSIALEDVWDHSSGGDGFGDKKFLGQVFV
jgi:hypothetical protein